MADADGAASLRKVRAASLRCSLDRSGVANMSRDGETAGLRWRVPRAESRLPPACRRPTELVSLSCRWQVMAWGARSGHYRGNDTAPQRRDDENAANRTRAGCDGFTLIEVLAALAIASVIIMASAALIHNVALSSTAERGA